MSKEVVFCIIQPVATPFDSCETYDKLVCRRADREWEETRWWYSAEIERVEMLEIWSTGEIVDKALLDEVADG